jgi:hypothetical protein
MVPGRPPKLLFLILAHDRPADAAALARTLTAAASDGRALIHFDAGAPDDAFAALRAATADAPRVGLVRRRVRCGWGTFGLVQAVFEAFAQIEAAGDPPDRVILLSGACLPCRPVRQLERFLAARPAAEFIEVEDESWILDGLRSERHTLWFPLQPLRRPWADRLMVRAQRLLGVSRRFPDGLTPRFGSQWWALTWPTCAAMLAWTRAEPRAMRFFRRVWIPDEMVIQTLAHRLAPPGSVAGFGLTHLRFTDRGKSVVFYDDHIDGVADLPRFFLRKAAPEAGRLRARCLALAAAPDDGAPLDDIGAPRLDYELKVRAQTYQPVPGQPFYGDQTAASGLSVLRRVATPYVVVHGPDAMTLAVADALAAGPGIERLGRLFAPGRVDFGPARDTLGGLGPGDAAIRDLHPALYLARVRRRCDRPPVIRLHPFDAPGLFADALRDPAALVVVCAPQAPGPEATQRRLVAACGGAPPPGVDRETWIGALADGAGGPAPLAEACAERTVVMPWAADGEAEAARAARFRRGLEVSAFAAEPWFPTLARALEAVWAQAFAGPADPGAEAPPPPALLAGRAR